MTTALPVLVHDLDPKRIAATAATIAVHVLALMLLLAPVEWSPPQIVEPPTETTIDWKKPEPKPIPPPDKPKPVTPERPQTAPQRAPIAEAPPVVTNETGPMAIPYEPVDLPPADTFEPAAPSPVDLAMRIFPAPAYPAREARMGITGRVLLRVEVDAEGKPVNVTIEQSSGNSALDKAAQLTVMRKWRFVPAQRNGENVPAVGLVPINFVLD